MRNRKDQRNDETLQEDDGRTIADMNVDGMPWYVPGDENRGRERSKKPEQLDREQLRMYRWAALKAGLLVVAVFGLTYFLFILLLDYVILR